MYKLVIGDSEYSLPNDFTIDKWVELHKWQSIPDRLINLAMGIPLDEVKIIPEETKTLALALVYAIMNPEWLSIKKEINNNKLIEFNSMTLGQFIDLEVYTNDYFKKFPDIVKVLYGLESTDGLMISDVHTAVQSYLKWRILLYKQYSNLFNAVYDEDEVVEDNHSKTSNPAHMWLDIVMVLADSKFLNMDAVLEKPVIQAFNWLAWNKDRMRKEQEELNKIR